MFGIDIKIIALMIMVLLCVAAVMYAIMYDRVATEKKQEQRVKSIRQRDNPGSSQAAARLNDSAKRRKDIQDSLLQHEKQNGKKKKESLKRQLAQAGMSVTIQKFYLFSFIFAFICTIAALIFGGSLIVLACVFIITMLGLPRWFVSFKRKRRYKAFLEEFPNAVDVIVRGVRAGLPLNECLAIISREAKDPIRTEFERIVDAQKMGLPMSEAVTKLYENVPLAEANFFAIVISIQSSSGGNLSEALGNLSVVLRERKKMKAKVQAMSSEAKASGGIIGALPFLVGGATAITSPAYMVLLITHPTGNLILLVAAIMMVMGIMVMRNMINFDF